MLDPDIGKMLDFGWIWKFFRRYFPTSVQRQIPTIFQHKSNYVWPLSNLSERNSNVYLFDSTS